MIRIKTNDDIHHTCLMYGLKLAYRRHPQLARDLNATPPPFRRNPELPRRFIGGRMAPVCVQYYNNDIIVLHNGIETPVVKEFARSIMEEYLRIRHPFLLYKWNGDKMMSVNDADEIATINID